MATATVGAVDSVLAEVLRPGQDIVIAQAFGQPRTLVRALARHRDRLQGSRLLVGMLVEDLPDLGDVDVATFFPSGALGTDAGLRAAGARYVRRSLYELARALRAGEQPVDVLLAQATPARDGRRSLGLAVDFAAAAASRATTTVVEVHRDLPWSGPASTVADEDVRAVPADTGILTAEAAPPAAADRLATEVLRWIPDGATLELGMGRWATGLLTALRERRRLRLHTGALGSWLLELARAGALAPHEPIVATAAAGCRELYAMLEADPRIALAPADQTHDPVVLRALPAFRAVNSVLEVDLLGRASCERGRDGRRGGLAGLADFATGAAGNPDGLSIIALPATAGAWSRIVARLDEDDVSLGADAIDVVVTEHGSADLRGRDARERARALIAIAAPEHRRALERSAREWEL